MSSPETIDEYLDELADELLVAPRRLHRILAEAEDHLRAAAVSLEEEGFDGATAQREAIRRFGTPRVVAKGYAKEGVSVSPAFVHHLVISLISLAAAGMLAIGLSGLVALFLGGVAGEDYVAGNGPGVTYTPERCAQFLAYYPSASDCESAAVAHHFDEVVQYRMAAGVLGVVALAVYLLARRRWPQSRLPRLFVPTVGASLFGIAALGLLFLGLGETLMGTSGAAGAEVSGGAVAAMACFVYSVRLLPLLSSQSA